MHVLPPLAAALQPALTAVTHPAFRSDSKGHEHTNTQMAAILNGMVLLFVGAVGLMPNPLLTEDRLLAECIFRYRRA